MVSSKISIRTLLIILCFFSSIDILFAQKNNNEALYNWFDSVISKENLAINNGPLHMNYDRTLNGQNRYLTSNNFTVGSLNYDNQDYFNVNIKYDIYQDELILKPSDESDYISINLIKENIKKFKIHDKNFVNLDNILPTKFLEGYYEENLVGKSFIFYIKHYKENKELLKDNGVFIEYFYKNKYIIFHKNKFNTINNKSEIVKQFPDQKSKINDFYDLNKDLKKENELRFMETLMKYINNLIQ
ncbi:hypothetical protein [Flavobacterium sp.]|uniref:hypothetical protein n=1 Tax=Flavobacterium sp. TaxID=239 RepID=UPI0038FC98F7